MSSSKSNIKEQKEKFHVSPLKHGHYKQIHVVERGEECNIPERFMDVLLSWIICPSTVCVVNGDDALNDTNYVIFDTYNHLKL